MASSAESAREGGKDPIARAGPSCHSARLSSRWSESLGTGQCGHEGRLEPRLRALEQRRGTDRCPDCDWPPWGARAADAIRLIVAKADDATPKKHLNPQFGGVVWLPEPMLDRPMHDLDRVHEGAGRSEMGWSRTSLFSALDSRWLIGRKIRKPHPANAWISLRRILLGAANRLNDSRMPDDPYATDLVDWRGVIDT